MEHDRKPPGIETELIPADQTLHNAMEGVLIQAPTAFFPLTEIQRQALALYQRGWNVFPVPRPDEVRRYAELTGSCDPEGKPPYVLQPIFTARLHVCGPECKRRNMQTGAKCLPEYAEFINLFTRANLAVMAGRTSGNLCIIDADQNGERVKRELQARNIPHWAYQTGRGINFILRLAEGEAANLPKGKAKIPGVEIWGSDHFAVLPPSIHPTGVIYEWLGVDPLNDPDLPKVSIKELDWLGAKLKSGDWAEPQLFGLPDWTGNLSENNRKTLVSMFAEGERNTAIVSPLYDIAALIKRGEVSKHTALDLLYQLADRCTDRNGQPYPRKHIDTMLKSALNKRGLKPAREYKGGDNRKSGIYEKAARFASVYQWPGRTGQADRAVFMTLANRARIEGAIFKVSTREVALLANMTKKTAGLALRRLRCDKRLKKQTHPQPLILIVDGEMGITNEAYRYKFANFDHLQGCACLPHISSIDITGVTMHTPAHTLERIPEGEFDTFGRLGRVAQTSYYCLLQKPEGSITAIARATNQNRSSVSRAVKRLLIAGLVKYSEAEGVYYGEPITAKRFEVLAAGLNVLGRWAKRKRQYQREREIRASLQMAWARMNWQNVCKRGRDE